MTIKEKEVVIGSSRISSSDAVMDNRAKEATKAAINRAKVCNKPVAKYDTKQESIYRTT